MTLCGLPEGCTGCRRSDSLVVTAGKCKTGNCPSPATAARMMPPPSTGRFLGPAAHCPPSQAPACPTSSPRPQQRKKRRRAARGHILMTQESPDADSAQGMRYMQVHILVASAIHGHAVMCNVCSHGHGLHYSSHCVGDGWLCVGRYLAACTNICYCCALQRKLHLPLEGFPMWCSRSCIVAFHSAEGSC